MFMFRRFVIIGIIALTGCATHTVSSQQQVISWNTSEGVQRLSSSKHNVDFFKLANHFESQSNKLFCGPTSATIVLNALRLRQSPIELPKGLALLSQQDLTYLPKREGWSPYYKRYTQDNILDISPKPRAVILGQPIGKKEGKPIKDYGIQLHQLASIFEAHRLKVEMHVVSNNADDKSLKRIMVASLANANDYLVVNYQRAVLKQPKGGHISPIGAYHKPSDSFLILDTAPNKADWVWVTADVLIKAMQTFDTIENRGFLVVSEKIKPH
ncbi:MAG: phytochelatin synthase [Cycloclasticus sp.]|nr:MAG: phytochelatin synthase [Cycloclasticus sp.]